LNRDWKSPHSSPRLLAIKDIIETGERMEMKTDDKEHNCNAWAVHKENEFFF